MNNETKKIAMLTVALASAAAVATTYYLDSAGGNDANDGVTPATAWQTLAKANDLKPQPGDKILFKRGGVWRGTLTAKSGEEGRPVLYSSYGTGPKPVLEQSVDRSRPEDWFEESPGVPSRRAGPSGPVPTTGGGAPSRTTPRAQSPRSRRTARHSCARRARSVPTRRVSAGC